jgi:hypothetical protein
MQRLILASWLAALAGGVGSVAAHSMILPTTLCVGKKPGCYPTIQAAVNAAQDGDTINVASGTYAGGITIDKSVHLVGTAAASTIIKGGGPVLTIGVAGALSEPTVSIARITITGGLSNSNPFGGTVIAVGGGIAIPPAAANETGATVSISDSMISGNRATPLPLSTPPGPPCGSQACAFALGGGIDNSGALTLTDTRVTDNVAGSTSTDASVATDADGGAIYNHRQGTVTLQHSVLTGNRAAVSLPNGKFSNGGAIVDDGVLMIEDSTINGNSSVVESSVQSSFPFDVEQEANSGGIWISEVPGSSATITNSTVSWNSVSSTNTAGDVQALNGGIDDDGSLLLVGSSIDHNHVSGSVPPSSGFLAGAVDGGLQVEGVAIVRDSSISHNTLTASSANGTTNSAGAGIGNLSGQLTVERTLVVGNRASADGVAGLVLGGGVLNIAFGGGAPQLSMTDSVVTANRLTASPPITPQGGGIYTADIFGGGNFPVTLTGTVVAGNQPDQCFGC